MLSGPKLRVREMRLARAGWLLVVPGLVMPLAAAAQEDRLAPPEGWLARTDHGGDGMDAVREMPPGWHITTGPAGIFYHPETTARGEGAAMAKNVLYVEAAGDDLIFGVNDQEVFRMVRDGQHVDGVVGLRVNHGLNLHISALEVTPVEVNDG